MWVVILGVITFNFISTIAIANNLCDVQEFLFIFMMLLSTIMIPFAVVMIPQYIIFSLLKWVNSLLPLIVPGCLANVSMIFFLRQNLSSIPDELMEAAKLDGCGYFRTFWSVFLPLMKGAVGTQLTLWFMAIWNDYLAPTVFLRSEKQ